MASFITVCTVVFVFHPAAGTFFCSLSCAFLYDLGVYFCFVKLALMVLDTRDTNDSMFLGMKYYQENLIHQHCVYFRKNTILVCVYFLLLWFLTIEQITYCHTYNLHLDTLSLEYNSLITDNSIGKISVYLINFPSLQKSSCIGG